MVNKRDNRFRYALEVRDSSWFNDKVYDYLKDNKIALTWGIKDELETPPIITSDQIYIHFLGDSSINDENFGKIVKDRKKEIVEYVDIINKTDLGNYQNISIAFNNHFAGFGPQSANIFLNLMDKPKIEGWTNEMEKEQNNFNDVEHQYQKSISDLTHFKNIT